MENAGPVFCAGITMYTPLKKWGARHGGKSVGIVGLGGLGQMGVFLAKATGNEVTVISRSHGREIIFLGIQLRVFVNVLILQPRRIKQWQWELTTMLPPLMMSQ